MKRLIGIAATVIAAGFAATLAGCSGCAGCSGSTKNTALTNSNWFSGTNYKGIQPSFIVSDDHPEYTKEVIVYDVEIVEGSGTNTSYSVDYEDGTYTTEFYAAEYDWNGENIPEEFKADKTEILYCYKTTLDIKVKYTLKSGEESDWFEDSVVTESRFRAAANNLQPVYSHLYVKSTTPANLQAASLDDAYIAVNSEYENFYNYSCTQVLSYTTEDGETTQTGYSLSKVKNSVFDTAYLYTAVRSLQLSESLSQTISLFSAAAGGVTSYTVAGNSTAMSSEELTAVSGILDPDGDAETVSTVAVAITYNGGTLQGTTQTVWYAAVENADNNTSRATMLKVSVPLSYNLGTLNFNMKEIESTFWNG